MQGIRVGAGWIRRGLRVAAGALVVFGASSASADPVRTSQVGFGGSYNELGVRLGADTAWRWGLSDSGHPLLSKSHLTLGVSGRISPSYARLEAWAALAPLSLLELRGGVEPACYFGSFGSLLGFPDYDADFGRDVRRDRNGEGRAGFGSRLYASSVLQFETGRIAAQANLSHEWWRLDSSEAYVYEPARDVLLLSDGDTLLRLSGLLLVRLGDGGTRIGVSYQLTSVPAAPLNDIQRLGPVLTWEPKGHWLGLERPTLFVSAYRYIEDRSKQGELGVSVGVRVSMGR